MTMLWWNVLRWFTREWWKYLLTDLNNSWWFGDEGRIQQILCRIKGHPAGEIFFTLYRDEPDHRCSNCREDLG
jgi:hypothetical protein